MAGLRRQMDEGLGQDQQDPTGPKLRSPLGGVGDGGMFGEQPGGLVAPPGQGGWQGPVPDQAPEPPGAELPNRRDAGAEWSEGEPGRDKTKPRDFPSMPMGSNNKATPGQSSTPSPSAAEQPMQQYLTSPSVMQPAPTPTVLPSPSAQSLVNPMSGGGRMFGKQGGLLEGGYGLPDTGQGTNDPSDLLLMLTQLISGGGGGGGSF